MAGNVAGVGAMNWAGDLGWAMGMGEGLYMRKGPGNGAKGLGLRIVKSLKMGMRMGMGIELEMGLRILLRYNNGVRTG